MSVLTVVGKAESRSDFEQALEARIADGFIINTVIPLTVVDNERKFLAFVATTDEEMNPQILHAVMGVLNEDFEEAHSHETIEEAGMFAEENYGQEAFSLFSDPLKSQEIFKRDVLFGLIHTGEVSMCRARLDDKQIVLLYHFAISNRPNDAVATPLAILVDDDLASRLELPMKSSYDRGEK